MIPKRYIEYYGDQFRWFVGDVIDIDDPMHLGRMKIRIHGIHSESKIDIPDDDLPWAQILVSSNQGGTGVMGNILGIKLNSLVFGFFLDGQNSQQPVVVGSLPKEGDGNGLATGTQTKPYNPDSEILEPPDPYAAVYPHNQVYETQSGHVKEYDDTEGAERIRELHKSGTFYQIGPDGDLITHIVRDRYTVIAGNDGIHITGDVMVVINGNVEMQIDGNFQADIGGTCNITSEGNMSFNAPRIDLN